MSCKGPHNYAGKIEYPNTREWAAYAVAVGIGFRFWSSLQIKPFAYTYCLSRRPDFLEPRTNT
jgi:hypothetical protein